MGSSQRKQWVRAGAHRVIRLLSPEERQVLRRYRPDWWYDLSEGCFCAIALPAVGLLFAVVLAGVVQLLVPRMEIFGGSDSSILFLFLRFGLAIGAVGYFSQPIMRLIFDCDLRAGNAEVISFEVLEAVAVQLPYIVPESGNLENRGEVEMPAEQDPPLVYFFDLGDGRLMFAPGISSPGDHADAPCRRVEHVRGRYSKTDVGIRSAGELAPVSRIVPVLAMPEGAAPAFWDVIRGSAATVEADALEWRRVSERRNDPL